MTETPLSDAARAALDPAPLRPGRFIVGRLLPGKAFTTFDYDRVYLSLAGACAAAVEYLESADAECAACVVQTTGMRAPGKMEASWRRLASGQVIGTRGAARRRAQ